MNELNNKNKKEKGDTTGGWAGPRKELNHPCVGVAPVLPACIANIK